jgi:hypothetical protein
LPPSTAAIAASSYRAVQVRQLEQVAPVEVGHPGGRAAAAWRAIDLAVGEDGHVSLAQHAVHVGFALVEDHPIDAVEVALFVVADAGARLVPIGPDTVATEPLSDENVGQFLRDDSGAIRWLLMNHRAARRRDS